MTRRSSAGRPRAPRLLEVDLHQALDRGERVPQLVDHTCGHLADHRHLIGPQQVPLALLLLVPLAIDGQRQHVGHGLEEIGIILGELTLPGGVTRQNPVRPARAGDDHAHPADHPLVAQKRGPAEPRVGAEVVDDHRIAGEEGATRGRIGRRTERGMAHESLPPPRARPQQQRHTIGEEFQDVAVLRLEVPGDESGGPVHEDSQFEPGERALAQLGHGRLLAHAGLEHLFGVLLIRDVAVDLEDGQGPALVVPLQAQWLAITTREPSRLK